MGSVPTGPLQPLPTDFENWMGNRMTPSNFSESISRWAQPKRLLQKEQIQGVRPQIVAHKQIVSPVLSALFLLSLLPLAPLSSFEPLQLNDEDLVEDIPGDQMLALEKAFASVKTSGRTDNPTTSPWGWAVRAGGWHYDWGHGIALDLYGNAYVTGSFYGTATFGSTSLESSGGYRRDIFVAKLSSSGSWQWAINVGGFELDDEGLGIAVDSSGNPYVTGTFEGTATFGSTSLESSGNSDIFIAKLSSSGTWQWAVKAGGSSDDVGKGIAVSNGNAYVIGTFEGTATFGSTSLESSGNSDSFVAKLSSSGSWQWVIKAEGSTGSEIAVDSNGIAYVTGTFEGTATFGSTSLESSGNSDIFIAKLSSSGTWQWAVKAGGSSDDIGEGIALYSEHYHYVTGTFEGTATFGSTSLTSSGDEDIFVAKLSSSGSWQWAIKAGGSSYDRGYGIAVHSNGNAYVTGNFGGTATFGSTSLESDSSGTGLDMFVAKLSSSGSWQGAVNADGSGSVITVDSSGDAYVIGTFVHRTTFGSTSLESGSSGFESEIFIATHQDRDMDGVNNSVDSCSNGAINWKSDLTLDYDSDGCRDDDEDDDDDDDGISDTTDQCPRGALGWTSDSSTDYDSNGCRDVDEDDDDTVLNAEPSDEEQDSTTSGWSNSGEEFAIFDIIVPFLLISGIISGLVVFIRKRREKSPPTITPPFVTGQQVPIVQNQPQIPQPLHTHEVISAPPPQNQFVAPAPIYDPIPSVEQQWVDNQGRTWRRLNNGCTQMWNGTDWQDI